MIALQVKCPEKSRVKPGDVFGTVTVESFYGTDKRGEGYAWTCQCACGKVMLLTTKRLRRGRGYCRCDLRRESIPAEERIPGEGLDFAIRRLWPRYTQRAIAEYQGRSEETTRRRVSALGLAIGAARHRPRKAPSALAPLEMAPGHFAVDAISYELIMGRSPNE